MMRCPAQGGAEGSGVVPYFADFVEGRRGEILDAALCIFAEKGYEGGTMREIAGLLGLTEPALYRHYAGKEALFEDLVAIAGDRVVTQAGAMFDGLGPEDLHASLLGLIDLRRNRLPRDEASKPIMKTLLTAAPHNAAFREVFKTHLARPMVAKLEAFAPRIDAYYGISRTPEELASRLRAFLSLFVGYFMTGMMLDLPDDDEGIVDAMMAIMGWGLEQD
jgi:AcrR family transcriptional regulator